MLSQTIESAMNDQIKNELYSAYVYLSMSAYLESNNLPGFAHWMSVQAKEELAHAMKFYSYIHNRSGRVALQALAQPPAEFGSVLEVFQTALEHEQKVTAMIHNIYTLAVEQKDYASQVFLQWFIEEQVEEEKSAADVVAKLALADGKPAALLVLDREMGSRAGE